jgi:transcriptional regulator GlxA family with amidase domain
VVDDGDFLSGGGVTSDLDLALWLVEQQSGVKLTSKVERLLTASGAAPCGGETST